MAFPEPPTPAEFLAQLLIALILALALGTLAVVARRDSHSVTRDILAGLAFAAGATLCFVLGLALVYPHGHHDVAWNPSRPDLNYPLDAALGLLVWASYVFPCLRWRRAVTARSAGAA